MQKAGAGIGITFVRGPPRRVTREFDAAITPATTAASCGRGCDISAFFNASDYLIEPALKTGQAAGHR